MAANDSRKANSGATLGITPVACHEYDDWLIPAAKCDGNALFASTVIDVARGTQVIASILSEHLIDLEALTGGDESARVLLNPSDISALARLAVVSLGHLYTLSVNHVNVLNTQAEAAGAANLVAGRGFE